MSYRRPARNESSSDGVDEWQSAKGRSRQESKGPLTDTGNAPPPQRPKVIAIPLPRTQQPANSDFRRGHTSSSFARADRTPAQQQAALRTSASQQSSSNVAKSQHPPMPASTAAEPQQQQAPASDTSVKVGASVKPLGSWGSGVSFAQRLAEKERQAAAPLPATAQPEHKAATKGASPAAKQSHVAEASANASAPPAGSQQQSASAGSRQQAQAGAASSSNASAEIPSDDIQPSASDQAVQGPADAAPARSSKPRRRNKQPASQEAQTSQEQTVDNSSSHPQSQDAAANEQVLPLQQQPQQQAQLQPQSQLQPQLQLQQDQMPQQQPQQQQLQQQIQQQQPPPQQQQQQQQQQPPQQQRQQQEQPRRRAVGGVRGPGALAVNIGRGQALAAAGARQGAGAGPARPPSTPIASEAPRASATEGGVATPARPETPQDQVPTPSTPTPATPNASEPSGLQPFAQPPQQTAQPEVSVQPSGGASSSQQAQAAAQPSTATSSTNFEQHAASTESAVPAGPASAPRVPSSRLSAYAPKFTFGSFNSDAVSLPGALTLAQSDQSSFPEPRTASEASKTAAEPAQAAPQLLLTSHQNSATSLNTTAAQSGVLQTQQEASPAAQQESVTPPGQAFQGQAGGADASSGNLDAEVLVPQSSQSSTRPSSSGEGPAPGAGAGGRPANAHSSSRFQHARRQGSHRGAARHPGQHTQQPHWGDYSQPQWQQQAFWNQGQDYSYGGYPQDQYNPMTGSHQRPADYMYPQPMSQEQLWGAAHQLAGEQAGPHAPVDVYNQILQSEFHKLTARQVAQMQAGYFPYQEHPQQGNFYNPQQYSGLRNPHEVHNAPTAKLSPRQHPRVQLPAPQTSPVRHHSSQLLPHLPRSLSQSSEQAHPSHPTSGHQMPGFQPSQHQSAVPPADPQFFPPHQAVAPVRDLDAFSPFASAQGQLQLPSDHYPTQHHQHGQHRQQYQQPLLPQHQQPFMHASPASGQYPTQQLQQQLSPQHQSPHMTPHHSQQLHHQMPTQPPLHDRQHSHPMMQHPQQPHQAMPMLDVRAAEAQMQQRGAAYQHALPPVQQSGSRPVSARSSVADPAMQTASSSEARQGSQHELLHDHQAQHSLSEQPQQQQPQQQQPQQQQQAHGQHMQSQQSHQHSLHPHGEQQPQQPQPPRAPSGSGQTPASDPAQSFTDLASSSNSHNHSHSQSRPQTPPAGKATAGPDISARPRPAGGKPVASDAPSASQDRTATSSPAPSAGSGPGSGKPASAVAGSWASIAAGSSAVKAKGPSQTPQQPPAAADALPAQHQASTVPPSAAQPAAPQSQGDPTTAPTQEPSQPNTEASPSPDASPADGWAVTEDDIDQAKLLIPAERQPQAAAPAEAIKRASLAAPAGLRAPSSLALGAAVASTKESISLRPVSPRSVQEEPQVAPPAALSAPGVNGGSKAEPIEPRSFEGLDEPVVRSIQALCQDGESKDAYCNVRLQPRGLKNSGNLCFMNATLQALMAGSAFCSFFDALKAAAPALPAADLPTLQAFSQLAKHFPLRPQDSAEAQSNGHTPGPAGTDSQTPSQAGSTDGNEDTQPSKPGPKPRAQHKGNVQPLQELGGQALVPDMMYSTLDIFNPHNAKLTSAAAAGKELTLAQKLSRGKGAGQREQEDAQEFLTFLLDSTHQELLKLRAMYGTQGSATSTSYDESWEQVSRKGKGNVTRGQEAVQGGHTLTSQIYGGAVQSTVKAARSKASVTVQPFNLLHLDILNVNNVTAGLQQLTKPEDIHDYKATDTSAPVTAKKEIKLLRLPKVLVLHMCRFTYTDRGLDKLHNRTQFSPHLRIQQGLLADDCEQRRQGGAEYELTATVSHHGRTPASGHYTADVRQPDGEWLRFDDDYVSHVNLKQVLSRDTETYLLFYEMKPQT